MYRVKKGNQKVHHICSVTNSEQYDQHIILIHLPNMHIMHINEEMEISMA